MEEEARLILRNALGGNDDSQNLAEVIHFYFGPGNGLDLELPSREPSRDPPIIE